MALPLNVEKLEALKNSDPVKYRQVEAQIARVREAQAENPLYFFRPHGSEQLRFLKARTHVQAAFAGNRFGKTAALSTKALIQHVPDADLPPSLLPFKVATSDPVIGRVLCPSEQVMHETLIPEFKKWAPRFLLLGGSWDKAWDKAHDILRFKDGGRLSFYTYKQDPETMEGTSLDYVGYDEPPPEEVRNACLSRLIDRDGFEMFAMTPVNMKGGGIGWIYRKIWKQREADDVTVIRGSGHDNPNISEAALNRILREFPEEERRAREFGEFMHFGGMVYPGGFEQRLIDPPAPSTLNDLDIVVGLDPGLKNFAIVWVAFDQDNRAFVFEETVVQEGNPLTWVKTIRDLNKKWGITDAYYVIDPSARNRSMVGNQESVTSELNRLGIYPIPGQNDVFAGVSQVRKRLQDGGLFVSKDARGLRDEAEEYRQQDRPDQEFAVVKENDHRLDAMRYVLMSRAWVSSPVSEEQHLGWVPGRAPSHRALNDRPTREVAPMGLFS